MRRFLLIVIIAAGALVPPLPSAARAGGDSQTAAAASATLAPAIKDAERITQAALREDVQVIASDEMGGRDTPSPGLDAAARFIADRLAKLKVTPAGDDGTYFQSIALRSTQVDTQRTRAELAGRQFRYGTDFLPSSYVSGEASAPLVYVGHGWVVRPKNINAYEGLDVRDKIMIVAGSSSSLPKGLTLEEVRAMKASDWESPVSYAQRNGARGLVFVPRNFDRAWRRGLRTVGRSAYQVERFIDEEKSDNKGFENGLPSILPSASMLEAIFAGEPAKGEEILRGSVAGEPVKGFALQPSKRLTFSTRLKTSTAKTQNVVGIVEGSDRELRKEYVAIGAHYDHVGTGTSGGGCRPKDGDTICNGADDDASGTAALLSMAAAFTEGRRPRRSILFVWHTGEEKGLWGSEYFTKYPTVPIDKVVAQLNIDMIGRSRPAADANTRNRMLTGADEIYVVGSRVLSAELGDLNERVNRAYLNLKYNFHYDEPNDPEQLWARSDHFNYALRGIPIVFFFDGIHEDYHQPSDSPEKLDYRKLERVARTIFVLASEVANAPQRPAIDKKLPVEMRER
ncbi:MAG TPA: M20/M25/M40 family metallo-hydrolase [Pyrinomonadaceae bacterium]|nr:M20/M25/M40 family metallo-hydrolase [Pyrinomonadaceae bacterium]